MSSVRRILTAYVIPICAVSLIYNLPKFFELKVEYSPCNSVTKEDNITLGQGYDSEEYFYEIDDCEDGVRAELMVRKYQMTIYLLSADLLLFLAHSPENE